MLSQAVAAVGDNTIDLYVGLDSYSYVGGNAVNVAVQLTRLGRPAWYFGAVGPDAAGQQIRAALVRTGVDVQGMAVLPGRTSTSRIRVSQDGVRHFEAEDFGVCDGYLPDDEALERIAGCGAAHIGLMPGAEPVRRYLTGRGVLVSQDCGVTLPVGSYRWMGIAFCSAEATGRPAGQIARDAVAGGAAARGCDPGCGGQPGVRRAGLVAGVRRAGRGGGHDRRRGCVRGRVPGRPADRRRRRPGDGRGSPARGPDLRSRRGLAARARASSRWSWRS